jgi:transcription antitermination protein NusB
MATTDRAVLRLAVVELLFVPGVPDPVTINEAIDLAKRYGGDGSGGFVNGVLDAIRRRIDERRAEPAITTTEAALPGGEPTELTPPDELPTSSSEA